MSSARAANRAAKRSSSRSARQKDAPGAPPAKLPRARAHRDVADAAKQQAKEQQAKEQQAKEQEAKENHAAADMEDVAKARGPATRSKAAAAAKRELNYNGAAAAAAEREAKCSGAAAAAAAVRPEEKGDEQRGKVSAAGDFVDVGGVQLAYPLLSAPINVVEEAFRGLGGEWGRKGDVHSGDSAHDRSKILLTYGEMFPDGVRELLNRCNAGNAKKLVDLGAGKGRVAMQAFLEHPSLTSVLAIEFSRQRYDVAVFAMQEIARKNPTRFALLNNPDQHPPAATLSEKIQKGRVGDRRERRLEVRCQDLFEYRGCGGADIVICSTDIPPERKGELSDMITGLKMGARLVLYHELCDLPHVSNGETPHSLRVAHSNGKTPAVVFERPPQTSQFNTTWGRHREIDVWTRAR